MPWLFNFKACLEHLCKTLCNRKTGECSWSARNVNLRLSVYVKVFSASNVEAKHMNEKALYAHNILFPILFLKRIVKNVLGQMELFGPFCWRPYTTAVTEDSKTVKLMSIQILLLAVKWELDLMSHPRPPQMPVTLVKIIVACELPNGRLWRPGFRKCKHGWGGGR